MFTGLVAADATVRKVVADSDGVRLYLDTPLAGELRDGDSVAVNGVCLTAVEPNQSGFRADVMAETTRRSALGQLEEGDAVNVELPVRPTDRLGGHILQGHVDGIGTIVSAEDDGFARRVRIECARELLRYVVEKGSIAVDGVSLTVVDVDDSGFSVSLIPETLERTTLGAASGGTTVNLEVDVVAKYVEKLMGATR
jgi:riboflavin synthase